MKKLMSFVFAALFAATTANAATLLTEDFSYPDGSLVPNGGWVNHSGTAGDLLVDSGAAVVEHGAPSEDAHVKFVGTPLSSGVVTATFDIVVDDDTVIGGGDYEYFAHFMEEGTFNFVARLDIVAPEDGGDYTLGISADTSTAQAVLGVDFAFGDTVAVTLSYDISTAIATLSAGGETEFSSVGNTNDLVDSFAFRQSDSSNNETIIVDNLVVTGPDPVVPEPTSVALVLFGASAFGAVSMRRRLG